jgi:hypothetical protein
MLVHELRDPETARTYCEQSLWLMRVMAPKVEVVEPVLAWALEVLGTGAPLPPLGFLADVGHLLFEPGAALRHESLALPGWPAGLPRLYEDHVLGKLDADGSFERAGDALRRYQGRDRGQGLAFLVNQLWQRADLGGIHFTPALVKGLRARPAAEVLAAGWDSAANTGPLPLLVEQYEAMTTRLRSVAAVLGPEDIFELEHRTAIAKFSQRVALRQVLQAAARLEESAPRLRPPVRSHRHEVPTHLLDEDSYPVGGFTSISTRGSVESLLHSQLAYMEPTDRPDLFDVKFLRDELLYYSRDENEFRRRRRRFLFALFPDLEQARFKDADLPWQRIILALGMTLTALKKLLEWLGEDSLVFEFLLIDEPNRPKALQAEEAVLPMVLREQIANGSAIVARMDRTRLAGHCVERARRSLCHCLTLSARDQPLDAEGTSVARLALGERMPVLTLVDENATELPSDDAMGAWCAVLERVLQDWQ